MNSFTLEGKSLSSKASNFRKRHPSSIWRVSPRVCEHSHLRHRPLLSGQTNLHRHLKGRHHLPLLRSQGPVHALSVPPDPPDRDPRPHTSSLLLRHHLHDLGQLLCHDQAGHRVRLFCVFVLVLTLSFMRFECCHFGQS